MESIVCKNCHLKNNLNSKFCSNCGTKLEQSTMNKEEKNSSSKSDLILFPIELDIQHIYSSDNAQPKAEKNIVTLNFENGIYEGEIKNNLFHGFGKFMWTAGVIHENFSEKQRLLNGDIYEGGWVEGFKHGFGVYRFNNGDIYEGNFIKDIKSGLGKYYFQTGEKFEGEFLNNFINGKGKSILPNGNVYEGEYSYDKFHGFGKMTYSDGVYVGYWEYGKRHGKGKFTHPNGNIYEGDFANDSSTGKGVFIFFNDINYIKYVGEYSNGLCHGKGEYYLKNGTVKKCTYSFNEFVRWDS